MIKFDDSLLLAGLSTTYAALYSIRDIWAFSLADQFQIQRRQLDHDYSIVILATYVLWTTIWTVIALVAWCRCLGVVSATRPLLPQVEQVGLPWAKLGFLVIAIYVTAECFFETQIWIWFTEFQQVDNTMGYMFSGFFGVLGIFDILLHVFLAIWLGVRVGS